MKKNPVGYLKFEFNTRHCYNCGANGYYLDLGIGGLGDGTLVPCLAVKGIQAKSGSELKCEVEYSTANSWFNPVIVTVSDFEAISIDTEVEIHFMKMSTLRSASNSGLIQVSAY